MRKDLVVIVGEGQGGQDKIIDALTENGIKAQKFAEKWPRDYYVYFNGKYFMHKTEPTPDEFDVGGMIRTGKDFLLVSEGLIYGCIDIHSSARHNEITTGQANNFIIERGQKYYPDARIYVVPEGSANDGHIDLFCLLCPNADLLLLDTSYYGQKYFGGHLKPDEYSIYEQIAEMEGLKLILYDGSQDDVVLSMNACVLPGENDTDIVVLDKISKGLIRILNNHGVQTIGVSMPYISENGIAGKINCQTNIYFTNDFIENEFPLSEPLLDTVNSFVS